MKIFIKIKRLSKGRFDVDAFVKLLSVKLEGPNRDKFFRDSILELDLPSDTFDTLKLRYFNRYIERIEMSSEG